MAQQMTTRSFVVPTVSLTTLLLWIHLPLFAQAWQNPKELWQASATGTNASLRGLELCADGRIVWTCGSQSTVLRSNDLGQTWQAVNPAGFDKLEFRSIKAWDSKRAIVASAGTPAIVLSTEDGGETWHEILRRTEEKVFFDALKFFNSDRGVLLSDPVDDKWLLLTTSNGGRSWKEVPRSALPKIQVGEAAFAASNSALHVTPSGQAWIGTGGIVGEYSRVYYSTDFGETWHDSLCPIPSGEASGIFSIASVPSGRLVAVGGDYRPDQHSPYKAAYSDDAGKTWHLSAVQPNAFRSSVVVLTTAEGSSDTEGSSDIEGSSQFWVATGPSGTDISPDGEHWVNGSTLGFHALASHPNGTLIAVGSEGRFGRTNAQVIRRTMEPSR